MGSRLRAPHSSFCLRHAMKLSPVLLLLGALGLTHATAFTCPTVYTLTSAGCASFCTDASIPSDSCVYYPRGGEYECTATSVGYCAKTSDAACSVKCLSRVFLSDDSSAVLGNGKPGKSLSLGVRGSSGSFGRSEPIDVIQNLAVAEVTKLTIKDFMIDPGVAPAHKISLLPTTEATPQSVLQTLELVNVELEFGSNSSLFSPSLLKLVLNNNALAMTTSSSSLRQDSSRNDTTRFPMEIFSLSSLQTLDIRGNPSLKASSFSDEQLAFFKKLQSFSADFSLN